MLRRAAVRFAWWGYALRDVVNEGKKRIRRLREIGAELDF